MNWYVLFVLETYKELLCTILRQNSMDAFFVTMEYYRKDRRQIETKTAFPGYVFVCTPLSQEAFGDKLQALETKKGLIKQLKYKEAAALRPEEIRVFEQFLDDERIFRMSYGHLEQKRIVIDSGPLKGFEDYITKYDKRNRVALLDLTFLDQHWLAGVTLSDIEK